MVSDIPDDAHSTAVRSDFRPLIHLAEERKHRQLHKLKLALGAPRLQSDADRPSTTLWRLQCSDCSRPMRFTRTASISLSIASQVTPLGSRNSRTRSAHTQARTHYGRCLSCAVRQWQRLGRAAKGSGAASSPELDRGESSHLWRQYTRQSLPDTDGWKTSALHPAAPASRLLGESCSGRRANVAASHG